MEKWLLEQLAFSIKKDISEYAKSNSVYHEFADKININHIISYSLNSSYLNILVDGELVVLITSQEILYDILHYDEILKEVYASIDVILEKFL